MKKTIILFMCIALLSAIIIGCDSEAGLPGSDSSDNENLGTTESDGNEIGRETPGSSTTPDVPDPNVPDPNVPDPNAPDPNETGGSGGNGEPLEEVLQKVYDSLDESLQLPFLMTTPLSNDMEYGEQGVAYYIGTKDVPFIEGVASEAAIGAIPYSVVLLRLEHNANMENAKSLIRDNVDPMKWICALADFVVVDSVGDLLILIMTNNDSSPGLGAAIHEGFLNLG